MRKRRTEHGGENADTHDTLIPVHKLIDRHQELKEHLKVHIIYYCKEV